ncbi:TetR/AcrR family transcriptional regulator [Nocardia yamanashiensis]|uniref:TetR/AcrR family transcriptional regulator n=1 Tax=Nocardia yamanashiensis TaxID=209247 RepID=UPI00082E8D39|nr:TetR/AcrR family transcriptional regulator [Nocardia yamanashiensis]
MTDAVKRPYRAAKRAETAAATRAAIRRAATELFVEKGYVATPLREVAKRAGVGERTLYDAFPTKLDLFQHTLNVATVGDEEPIAVADRPEVLAALDDPDPRAALTGLTGYTAELFERAGDLIMVGVDAAAADPAMRAGDEAGANATRALWLTCTGKLAERGSLRAGLDPETAADILFALGSPHIFRLLRRRRAWSADRYRNWLRDSLIAQVL